MNIRQKDVFGYELGVLLFNLLSRSSHALKINNDYDVFGNVQSLWNSLEDVSIDFIRNGFIAECQYYNIEEKEALSLFEEVLSSLNDE